jgi:hypothetical protein
MAIGLPSDSYVNLLDELASERYLGNPNTALLPGKTLIHLLHNWGPGYFQPIMASLSLHVARHG